MLKPCEQWNERLSAYLDGEASSSERTAVEEHLAACPTCRAGSEILRCDAQDVTAALALRGASDGFAERVLAQLAVTPVVSESDQPERPSPSRWTGWHTSMKRNIIVLAFAITGVLVLVLVIGNNWANNRPMNIAMSPSPQASLATRLDQKKIDQLHSLGYLNGLSNAQDNDESKSGGKWQAQNANPELLEPPKPTIIPPALNYGLADKLMIAYTASLSIRSPEVQRSMEKAELLFQKYNGFVLNSEYTVDDKDQAAATVSGRIPSAKLGQLLVELDGLGELRARSVNGEDLTAEQLKQIEQLGDSALKQEFLTNIEGRSNSKTALDAESKRANARSEATGTLVEQYKLKSRVTLAEVTVQIAAPPKKQEKPNPVKQSASKSFHGLRSFGMWLITAVLIPLAIWLPVWGLLVVLFIVLKRRYWRNGFQKKSDPE